MSLAIFATTSKLGSRRVNLFDCLFSLSKYCTVNIREYSPVIKQEELQN